MTHNTTTPETVVLADTTDLPPADDAVAEFDLPFDFNFYGQPYTSVEVSTNGNIQFQSTSIAWVDSIFPINLSTPAQQVPILAMYYVDLNPDLDWMQQTTVTGQPGNRQAVVRYNSVPVCPFDQDATHNDTANDTSLIDAQPSVSCDVVLYEIDSHIEIRYYNIDPTPWPVDVGVQGSGVNDWTAAVDHQPMTAALVQWLANSTLTFTPVCMQFESVPPVGAESSTGGTVSIGVVLSTGATISTAATASTGSILSTTVTVPVSGTAPLKQANAAMQSKGSVGLLVVLLVIISQSQLL